MDFPRCRALRTNSSFCPKVLSGDLIGSFGNVQDRLAKAGLNA
jgi:hypothetical protein